MTDPALLRPRLEQSFSKQAFMTTIGAWLGDVTPGRVEILSPIRPEFGQQHGFAHAGLTFALGDSAAGYAALSVMEPGHEVLTTEMKINLLAPARGDQLVAMGEVIKPGRRLVIVRAEVRAISDGESRLVAALMGTMIPVPVLGK
ncbi:MAG: PaaI family thioesterase [Brevirhabdus sp.]